MLDTPDIAKVITAFTITVFLIYILYYFVSKYYRSIFSINQRGEIKIKEIKIIGKGKSLILLEVKDKEYLLSVDEKGISVIDVWKKSSNSPSDDSKEDK